MTFTINEAAYINLLTLIKPRVISNEEENLKALSQVEKLMAIAHRSLEQDQILELLIVLIEKFESENYLIDVASPHEVLLHLMEEHDLKQADLVGILGSSGVTSEVVNGKRGISKNQAKALGEFFKVSVGIFI
jgi:HTH-type transcriptional regulator / antitoxin HigA